MMSCLSILEIRFSSLKHLKQISFHTYKVHYLSKIFPNCLTSEVLKSILKRCYLGEKKYGHYVRGKAESWKLTWLFWNYMERLVDCQHIKPVATIYSRSVENSVLSYTSKNSVWKLIQEALPRPIFPLWIATKYCVSVVQQHWEAAIIIPDVTIKGSFSMTLLVESKNMIKNYILPLLPGNFKTFHEMMTWSSISDL